MKHLSKLLVGAALMVPAVSSMAANDMMGQAELYATRTGLDVPAAPYNESGTGFGVKGWVMFGGPFGHLEYQKTTVGDTTVGEVDVDQLRLGGGYAFKSSDQVYLLGKVEYVKVGLDSTGAGGSSEDFKGFGIHGGAVFMPAPQFDLMGTLGYLSLSGDDVASGGSGDVKGLELNVGAGYHFTKEFGASLDYRRFMGSYSDADAVFGPGSDDGLTLSDIRLGVTFNFGG